MALSFIASVRSLRWLLFVSLIILTGLSGANAQTQLSAAQTRVLAFQLLENGNPEAASQLAKILLQRDADDLSALVALARAEWMLGNPDASARAWGRAFRQTENPAEKFAMARKVAEAQFAGGHHTRSEWWLRRANNFANTEAERRAVANEFSTVRRRNPLSVNLNFSLAPNNNVNNGSSSETITIWNLPFVLSADAQALSGYEASLGVDLRYKLSESGKQRTDVGLSLFGRTFELSKEAKEAAPDADGSDYAYGVAELSLQHRRLIFPNTGVTSFGLLTGKNWYGGDALTRYNRLTIGQDFGLGESTSLNVRATGEKQYTLDDAATESTIHGLDASIGHRLGSGDILRFSLGSKRNTSDDEFSEYESRKTRVSYAFGKPILGTRMEMSLGLELRDYDVSRYAVDGRHDETVSAGLSFIVSSVDYLGFSPSVNIDASRTISNISLYDRESVGIRFGIQSNF